MTVIAYKNGTLACDSCWNDGGIVVTSMTKIKRLKNGALYGAAGDDDDRELVALLNTSSPSRLPSRARMSKIIGEISAIVIYPGGAVYLFDVDKEASSLCRAEAPFHAIGSGRQVAMGAMAAGAMARIAVEIACRFVDGCRPPVCSLTL